MRRRPRLRSEQLSRSAALALSAALMLVPANILPIVAVHNLGRDRTDTIFSGIVELWERGLWAIAVIVFVASIAIPALKLAGLACLLRAARRPQPRHARRLTKLYNALSFIGRWSMLDVFLVAFLAGVVRFGTLSTVEPRSGLVAFAASVVLTLLATHAFDPRVLWRRSPLPSAAASPSP